jgi:hypothetical protein
MIPHPNSDSTPHFRELENPVSHLHGFATSRKPLRRC